MSRATEPASQHPLLADLDALAPAESREVACALSMLWDEFNDDSVGPLPLSGASRDGAGYILTMRLAAYRVRQNGGQEKLHFALAPELMALYAEVLTKPEQSPRDLEIAATIEQLANRGALIRRAGVKPANQAQAA
jgi:hypothetical protein